MSENEFFNSHRVMHPIECLYRWITSDKGAFVTIRYQLIPITVVMNFDLLGHQIMKLLIKTQIRSRAS